METLPMDVLDMVFDLLALDKGESGPLLALALACVCTRFNKVCERGCSTIVLMRELGPQRKADLATCGLLGIGAAAAPPADVDEERPCHQG